jgi:ribosomal protein S6--L-glutamate ligase
MKFSRTVIALEARLKKCRNVMTLGVRPVFGKYPEKERKLILEADKIYYPSTFYADLFDAMGKSIFPSYHNYKCVQDKIKQTTLFEMLRIPHPRTKVYYGKHQQKSITEDFRFPFVAKIPRGSALGRGVFLVHDQKGLKDYLDLSNVAYIQEYLDIDRDIRVVVIGNKVVHGYWRVAPEGEFRSNLSQGGTVRLDNIPSEAKDLALHVAALCRWNDVGIDICVHRGKFYVLEGNMKYGKEGFRAAGIDYIRLMEGLIENGEI